MMRTSLAAATAIVLVAYGCSDDEPGSGAGTTTDAGIDGAISPRDAGPRIDDGAAVVTPEGGVDAGADAGPFGASPRWKVAIDDSIGTTHVHGVRIANDGSVLVAGTFRGTIAVAGTTFPETDPSHSQAFILRIAADGAVVWAKALGPDNGAFRHADITSLAVDDEGNAIAALQCAPGCVIDGKRFPAGESIVAFGAGSGKALWTMTPLPVTADGAPPASVRIDAVAARGGRTALSGRVLGQADFPTATGTITLTSGSSDIFVATLDAQGNTMHAVAWRGEGAAEASAVDIVDGLDVDPAGDLVGIGHYAHASLKGPGVDFAQTIGSSPDEPDDFVVKLAPDLQSTRWALAVPLEPGRRRVLDHLGVDANGTSYIAGRYRGPQTIAGVVFPDTNAAAFDAFLLTLSPSGAGVASTFAVSNDNDVIHLFAVAGSGDYVIGGPNSPAPLTIGTARVPAARRQGDYLLYRSGATPRILTFEAPETSDAGDPYLAMAGVAIDASQVIAVATVKGGAEFYGAQAGATVIVSLPR